MTLLREGRRLIGRELEEAVRLSSSRDADDRSKFLRSREVYQFHKVVNDMTEEGD